MLALKPLMLGVSVWNSQKVTTCLLLAEAFCATTPPVTANRVQQLGPRPKRLDLPSRVPVHVSIFVPPFCVLGFP